MRDSHSHASGPCSADCPYKKLYEGSQVSLTDMSARQAGSLARVGRLRAGVITVLRRSYPEVAVRAEQAMGRRLADVDDEVLLSLLESVSSASVREDERAALKAIASALLEAGYVIDPQAHPSTWVSTIRRVGLRQPGPATPAPTVEVVQKPLYATGDAPPQTRLERNDIGDLFAESPAAHAHPAGSGGEWPEDMITGGPRALADLFEPSGSLWDGDLGEPADYDEGWSPSPVRVGPETNRHPAPPAAVPPAHTLIEPPVRPELFPPTTPGRGGRGRKGRSSRVHAEPADPYVETLSAELDDSLRQALIAASAIPRPVFTRDLVAVAGAAELVDAWEDECRAQPERYPVRFIAPKQRHKLRGSLVIPDDSVRVGGRPHQEDWWTRCIELYRAARLYEMGVLLHRVGDELVSARFSAHVATLRLNSPRGLVGVVVCIDDRVETGEPARAELAAAMEELLRERLSLVVVLSSAGEERELARLIGAVGELARERGWAPSFPVIGARSWEYADDRGTTAQLVLGS